MKRFWLSLSLVATGFFAFAQEENNPNAPVIKFEKEEIDYGTIDQNADGTRQFVFTNEGKEPLIINNATGSCGCTVPTWPREPIAAGEKGIIKVQYDTKRTGSFTKSVTINSNAKTPEKVLRIKGFVKKVEPAKTVPEKEEKASMIEN